MRCLEASLNFGYLSELCNYIDALCGIYFRIQPEDLSVFSCSSETPSVRITSARRVSRRERLLAIRPLTCKFSAVFKGRRVEFLSERGACVCCGVSANAGGFVSTNVSLEERSGDKMAVPFSCGELN